MLKYCFSLFLFRILRKVYIKHFKQKFYGQNFDQIQNLVPKIKIIIIFLKNPTSFVTFILQFELSVILHIQQKVVKVYAHQT